PRLDRGRPAAGAHADRRGDQPPALPGARTVRSRVRSEFDRHLVLTRRRVGAGLLAIALVATSCSGGAKKTAAAREPRAGGTTTASGPTSCARPSSPTPSGPVIRVRGQDRDGTAIALSVSQFPSPDHPGLAKAALLASDANYPDALAGAPLAIAKDGPLLLTAPSGLNPAVADEL